MYTSGGVAAGIDLALELTAKDCGRAISLRIARELVVFMRRSGAQAQYSLPLRTQAHASDGLAEVCQWLAANLEADLSVERLAERARLSPRQFSRRFRDEFGMPPGTYVKRVRLDTARELLMDGSAVAQVARTVGFASEDGFRRAFEGCFGTSPSAYRRQFRRSDSCVA